MASSHVQAILKPHLDRLLFVRAHPKTICPSEVARALSQDELRAADTTDWRNLMPTIRDMLWEMRAHGEVEILQKGEPIPEAIQLQDVKGPIRARGCV